MVQLDTIQKNYLPSSKSHPLQDKEKGWRSESRNYLSAVVAHCKRQVFFWTNYIEKFKPSIFQAEKKAKRADSATKGTGDKWHLKG